MQEKLPPQSQLPQPIISKKNNSSLITLQWVFAISLTVWYLLFFLSELNLTEPHYSDSVYDFILVGLSVMLLSVLTTINIVILLMRFKKEKKLLIIIIIVILIILPFKIGVIFSPAVNFVNGNIIDNMNDKKQTPIDQVISIDNYKNQNALKFVPETILLEIDRPAASTGSSVTKERLILTPDKKMIESPEIIKGDYDIYFSDDKRYIIKIARSETKSNIDIYSISDDVHYQIFSNSDKRKVYPDIIDAVSNKFVFWVEGNPDKYGVLDLLSANVNYYNRDETKFRKDFPEIVGRLNSDNTEDYDRGYAVDEYKTSIGENEKPEKLRNLEVSNVFWERDSNVIYYEIYDDNYLKSSIYKFDKLKDNSIIFFDSEKSKLGQGGIGEFIVHNDQEMLFTFSKKENSTNNNIVTDLYLLSSDGSITKIKENVKSFKVLVWF